MMGPMIAVFTDFGAGGLYAGQVRVALEREAPGHPVVDLMHDAPAAGVRPAACLLGRLAGHLPPDAVVLAVVDPGVGSAREPCIVAADGRRFVGPDNGLFEYVIRGAAEASFSVVTWRPERLSDTFHGRDLFAPVAARLAAGRPVAAEARPLAGARRGAWPDSLAEVVHVDRYGNAVTGVPAAGVAPAATVSVAGRDFRHARTYAEAGEGAPFWYGNSLGLVEVAVGCGDAAAAFGIGVGMEVAVRP